VIGSRAILIALGMTGKGAAKCWRWTMPSGRVWQGGLKTFLLGMRERGLRGCVWWSAITIRGCGRRCRKCCRKRRSQRSYVDFLRNARDQLPRKADDDCLQELRWMYERRDVEEARRILRAAGEMAGKISKLCAWVEATSRRLEFTGCPGSTTSTSRAQPAERFTRRSNGGPLVVRIFPGGVSCAEPGGGG